MHENLLNKASFNFFHRYHIKESAAKSSFLSELTIANTLKSDSDTLTCIASNPYGRDMRMFHLLVQGKMPLNI